MINPIDGSVNVNTISPRSSRVFQQSESEVNPDEMEEMTGIAKWGDLFKNISRLPIPKGNDFNVFTFPSSTCDNKADNRPIELHSLKHKPRLNCKKSYPHAVISLQPTSTFAFDLEFYRAFDTTSDKLEISFHTDKLFTGEPMKVKVEMNENNSSNYFKYKATFGWLGQITAINEDTLSVEVEIPPKVSLGRWNLNIITKNVNSEVLNESVSTLTGIYITD